MTGTLSFKVRRQVLYLLTARHEATINLNESHDLFTKDFRIVHLDIIKINTKQNVHINPSKYEKPNPTRLFSATT